MPEYAINPYNFIPFGEGPERKPLEKYYQENLLSGWFYVNLQIRTPLIIPDAAHPDTETITVQKMDRRTGRQKTETFVHKSYGFFKDADGRPAIPGSSLRGMLRSVYEAATDSCLPFLLKNDPAHPISQRTPLYAAFKDRGLLRYDKDSGQWSLYSVKAYTNEVKKQDVITGKYLGYKNGQKVRFSVHSGNAFSLGSGPEEGWLQFNIPVAPNKPYHVAVLQAKEQKYTEKVSALGPEDVSLYQSLFTSVHDTNDTSNHRLVSTLKDLMNCLEQVKREGGAVPCYYFIVERDGKKLVYLSGAAVGRVRQRRRWPDIMGQHSPCDQLDELCPTCALFGTVKDGGTAGRLTFSDAEALEYSEPEKRILPILSTPRTSSFEFYLRKPHPDATYWNFDYYGVYSYEKDGKTITVPYTDYRDLVEATPRGRKAYWHGEPQTTNKKSRMNATMAAMDKGNFRFRVGFDRITRKQLGDLLWCVTLGENDPEGNYCHKLGHGKPVGYGSVKMTVNEVNLRTITMSPDQCFSVNILSEDPASFMEAPERESALQAPQAKAILAMADTGKTKDKQVAYLTGADGNIYSWFSANRMSADDLLTLPEPMDEDLTLPTRRERRPARGLNPRGWQPQQQAQRPPAPQRGGGWAEKAPPQASQETTRKEAAASDFDQARERYPIGTEIDVKVQKVVGNHRLFFKLEGVPYQATAVFTSGKYWEGKPVNIRITGTGQNKEGYPNFVAEIVS